MSIEPNVGVLRDRRYAIKQNESVPDSWRSKGSYFVGANTPGMVRQEPLYLNMKTEEQVGKGGVRMSPLNPTFLAALSRELGVNGELHVLDTGGAFNATDTKSPVVSFLNLNSVRELSTFMGRPIDPRRFRMNIWFDGMKPFEELGWANEYPGTREIAVGKLRFRVDDACERCKAVEANPVTGEYDLPILTALDELLKSRGYNGSPHRGVHTVMGFLARPLFEKTSSVASGDPIRIV